MTQKAHLREQIADFCLALSALFEYSEGGRSSRRPFTTTQQTQKEHKMKIRTTITLALLLAATPALYADADDVQERILDAAKAGDASLTTLLSSGVSVNTTDDDGETALMEAADDGDTEAVRLLIKHGANVNAANEDGCTALMMAADEGHTQAVRVLIQAGADLNARDKEGKTALMMAEHEKHAETARVLTDAGAQ